jgi:hypothetical protein
MLYVRQQVDYGGRFIITNKNTGHIKYRHMPICLHTLTCMATAEGLSWLCTLQSYGVLGRVASYKFIAVSEKHVVFIFTIEDKVDAARSLKRR